MLRVRATSSVCYRRSRITRGAQLERDTTVSLSRARSPGANADGARALPASRGVDLSGRRGPSRPPHCHSLSLSHSSNLSRANPTPSPPRALISRPSISQTFCSRSVAPRLSPPPPSFLVKSLSLARATSPAMGRTSPAPVMVVGTPTTLVRWRWRAGIVVARARARPISALALTTVTSVSRDPPAPQKKRAGPAQLGRVRAGDAPAGERRVASDPPPRCVRCGAGEEGSIDTRCSLSRPNNQRRRIRLIPPPPNPDPHTTTTPHSPPSPRRPRRPSSASPRRAARATAWPAPSRRRCAARPLRRRSP